MKVFVDFDNALLLNSLELESFLLRCRNIFQSHKSQIVLSSLPYNAKTLRIIETCYSDQQFEIILLHNKKYTDFAEWAVNTLSLEINKLKISSQEINGSKLDTIKSIIKKEKFIYIGSTVMDYKIYQTAEYSSFVGSFVSYIVFLLICKKDKNSCPTMLRGLINTFFTHIQIIYPVLCIWPSWIEVRPNIIDFNKMNAIFIGTIGFMSAAHLFRSLISIDRERYLFKNQMEILLSKEFIIGSSSIKVGFLWLAIFTIIGLYSAKISITGFIIAIFFSIIFFYILLLKSVKKYILLGSCVILSGFLFNPTFSTQVLKLIYTI